MGTQENNREPKPFRRKLMTLFLLSILAPLLLTSALLLVVMIQMNAQESSRSADNLFSSVSRTISTYLDDLRRFASSPNTYSDIMRFYELIDSGGYHDIRDPLEYNQVINGYQRTIANLLNVTRNDIVGTVYLPMRNPSDSIFVTSRVDSGVKELPGRGEEFAVWREQAIALWGSPLFSSAHTVDYYGEPETVFSLICLVKNIDRRTDVGILIADIRSEAIVSIFADVDPGGRNAFALLDQEGGLLYATADVALQGHVEDGSVLEAGGERYLAYARTLPDTGWQLVYLASQRDLGQQVLAICLLFAAMAVCCLAFSLLIFRLRSQSTVQALEDLSATMRKVAAGDLTARAVPHPEVPDFYQFALELNQMTQRLDGYIKSEYMAVLERRNAEYLALQSQVNPHFLYNTLNGFLALNRMGEKRLLEDSIIELTHLFRYTCEKSPDSTILDEFGFLENYLSLQQMRYEERLAFQIHMDPAVADAPLPKLLIQPLVENSIVHGMENRSKPVLVEILADRVFLAGSPHVLVVVRDNGNGFALEDLPEKKRVGLQNVRERLSLFCAASTFTIQSAPDSGTICILTFAMEDTQ